MAQAIRQVPSQHGLGEVVIGSERVLGVVEEFDAVPGETYDIRIRRWSGTDDVWFGIAWTVTGGLLILDLDWPLRF